MKGINLATRELQRKVVEAVKESGLPSCLVDYVLTEILNEVRLKRMSDEQAEIEAEELENDPVARMRKQRVSKEIEETPKEETREEA